MIKYSYNNKHLNVVFFRVVNSKEVKLEIKMSFMKNIQLISSIFQKLKMFE